MGDVVAWGALIGIASAALGFAGFWLSRGKAEADAKARADAAMHVAKEAKTSADNAARAVADVELRMAREYATSAALAAVETRFLASIDGLRLEVRGMNTRLDRFLDRVMGQHERNET